MDCAAFEKWLFENPKEKNLPEGAEEHLKDCPKCSELWKIEAVLLEAPASKEKLFFPPQMRNYLVSLSRRERERRSSFRTIIEDSAIQALVFSVLLGGGAAAFPKVLAAGYFEKLKPYIGPVVNTLGPLFEKALSLFQVPGGAYLFAFMVFAATLSFEVYYKTAFPKHSFSRYRY